MSSLLQQHKSPSQILSSFTRPTSASKDKVFNNTLNDYVDDQICAVTVVLNHKKQSEKKKQDLRFKMSQIKEETQSLNKQISVNEGKYEKQMSVFNEGQKQVNAIMQDISRIRTKIETVRTTTEPEIGSLANEREVLFERINVFTQEYNYQNVSDRERLNDQREEIQRLNEETLRANRELDEVNKLMKIQQR